MGRETYNITKEHLDYEVVYTPKDFGRMPQLYLDLLENRYKLKAECRNSEYVPPIVPESELHKNKHIKWPSATKSAARESLVEELDKESVSTLSESEDEHGALTPVSTKKSETKSVK